jgi:anthranilate synthase/aminodeoxychorismate synthase-like glutamine amidotransferase
VLLVDNFDSFTWNIAHGLAAAGADVRVLRADQVEPAALEAQPPELLVLSPGPGAPEEARVALELLRRFGGRLPVFGVCLGMQCLAVAFGGKVGPAPQPVHGKTSRIHHDGRGFFEGLPASLEVGRYHSLCVTELPDCLEATAWTGDGVVMAVRHRTWAMAGVQFHPDSFLTEAGPAMMAHVLRGHY